jgi:GntR family transcriptional regulator
MITLSNLSRTPIYQQIIDQILAQIASGVLVAHTPMPAVRQLAKDLGINPNTVVKAYNELEHAGFLYTKQGVGSFVQEKNNNDDSLKNIKLDECKKELHLLKNLGATKTELQKILDELYTKEKQ